MANIYKQQVFPVEAMQVPPADKDWFDFELWLNEIGARWERAVDHPGGRGLILIDPAGSIHVRCGSYVVRELETGSIGGVEQRYFEANYEIQK